MPAALYFPFTRCLHEAALKRAVLLYDELIFIDSVAPDEREALYLREGTTLSRDLNQQLAARWRAAEPHYRLLEEEGLVRFVAPAELFDVDEAAEALVAGLEVDLELNQCGDLFRGHRPWSILEQRVPAGAKGPLAPWLRRGWSDKRLGETVIRVPYAVGSSVNLSLALAAAHMLGATPLTDHALQHELLRRRFASAATAQGPGLNAPVPSPLTRRLIELRVIEALTPAEALDLLSFERVLDYRREHADARAELTGWVDKLTEGVRERPWDPAFEGELREITEYASEVAARPGRWKHAAGAFKRELSTGAVVAAGTSAVVGAVAPGVSKFAAVVLGGSAAPAVKAFADGLREARAPEQNAIAYLLNAPRS